MSLLTETATRAISDTCKDYCNQQTINGWSNASLGIAEILFTSLNIIINFIVYKKINVSNRRNNVFDREALFKNNN